MTTRNDRGAVRRRLPVTITTFVLAALACLGALASPPPASAAAPVARPAAVQAPGAWLEENAIRLGRATSEDERLAALTPRLRGRRVIGLGEATHGTREINEVRARLVRHLVRQLGFRVFLIEDSTATASTAPTSRTRPARSNG